MAIYGNIENVDAVLLAIVTAEAIHIKGADGKDGANGITPHIGDNGNWYIGSTDTGKPSRGDTGATGPQGAPGIYYGTTQPTGDTHPVWIDPGGDQDDGGLLPVVTATDNGKFLRVVSGAWAAAEITSVTPLIGTTAELTPSQVQDAVLAGRPVAVQYTDSTYGVLKFTNFNIAASHNLLASVSIIKLSGSWVVYALYGYTSTQQWNPEVTLMATASEVNTISTRVNTIENAGYLTLATLPKYGGESE